MRNDSSQILLVARLGGKIIRAEHYSSIGANKKKGQEQVKDSAKPPHMREAIED